MAEAPQPRRRGRPRKRRPDDDDDEQYAPPGTDVPAAYAPAYCFGRPSKKPRRGAGSRPQGPQCSQHPDEFCFFCAYEKDPNAEAGSAADLYGSLVDLVNSMNRQKKEFPAIVDAVAVAYETQIRPHVHDPSFGAQPEWCPEAIERHLTFSAQFEGVFDSAVTQLFHSIVDAQNETVMDAVTGHVIEENRAALMSTLDHYMKWQRFQAGAATRAAKSSARK